MRTTVDAAELTAALSAARAATPSKPQLPAFAGLLLIAAGNRLQVVGSDGATSVTRYVAAEVHDDGRVLVPSRPLTSYADALEGGDVTLDGTERGWVSVSGSSSPTYAFRTIEDHYPAPGWPGGRRVDGDFAGLSAAVSAVAPSTDEHGGVCLSGPGLVLTSTDRHRASYAKVPGVDVGEFSGVIPLDTLQHATRARVEAVEVAEGGGRVRFHGPKTTVSSALLDVPAEDVASLVGRLPGHEARLSRTKVRRAVARLRGLASGERTPLRLTIRSGEVVLAASSADVGEGAERVGAESSRHADVDFLVSLAFFADAMDAQPTDEVRLCYSGPDNPLFVVGRTEDVEVVTVIAPMKA